ncbi:MAG TPA: hypothetical protein VFV96_17130 [Verrucomicrobiae bacterium]|nr:hypothetical protein [Verrucomicrobiae bacterium]
MFSIIGALMSIYGLVSGSNKELYERSLNININLIWGVFLLIFGIWMLWMALNARKNNKP